MVLAPTIQCPPKSNLMEQVGVVAPARQVPLNPRISNLKRAKQPDMMIGVDTSTFPSWRPQQLRKLS